jgi:hypothetical protein
VAPYPPVEKWLFCRRTHNPHSKSGNASPPPSIPWLVVHPSQVLHQVLHCTVSNDLSPGQTDCRAVPQLDDSSETTVVDTGFEHPRHGGDISNVVLIFPSDQQRDVAWSRQAAISYRKEQLLSVSGLFRGRLTRLSHAAQHNLLLMPDSCCTATSALLFQLREGPTVLLDQEPAFMKHHRHAQV